MKVAGFLFEKLLLLVKIRLIFSHLEWSDWSDLPHCFSKVFTRGLKVESDFNPIPGQLESNGNVVDWSQVPSECPHCRIKQQTLHFLRRLHFLRNIWFEQRLLAS